MSLSHLERSRSDVVVLIVFESSRACDHSYSSVPQGNPELQGQAIASIASYISDAAYFMVLAGSTWTHEWGDLRDVLAWASRGWCRLEQLANGLSPRETPLIICQSSTNVVTYGRGGMEGRSWLHAAVGLGSFTVDADRQALGPVIDELIEVSKANALASGDLTTYRLLHSHRAHLLRGTGHQVEEEPTLEAWLDAMRFALPTDGQSTGMCPLRYAVFTGRQDLVEALLTATPRLDVEAPLTKMYGDYGMMKGETVLCAAARHSDNPPMLKLLLDAKANPLRKCTLGWSSLFW